MNQGGPGGAAPGPPLLQALDPRVVGLSPSPTLAINERSQALRAAGRQVLRLGLGQSPFPVPAALVEALRARAGEKDYLPVRGLPALREAVAAYFARQEGLARGAEDVLIGPGTKELMFILSLAYPGELLLPSPSWVSYVPQAGLTGRPVRWLETDPAAGWRLDPATLEAACAGPARPRLLLLNTPCNPTGTAYEAAELEALAEVCRRRGVLVLSDEIYGGLHHQGRHVSLARSYPEGTIVSDGLSKWCGAGGWRLGAFSFPPGLRRLLDAAAAVASETFTSVSAPIQYAAVRGFQGGPTLDDYLSRSRRLLRALGRRCHQALEAAGWEVAPPQGGFYLLPRAGALEAGLRRRGVDGGAALCERLLEETGVATLPGAAFGRSPGELSLRLAYVDFDGAAALEALGALPPGAEPDEEFLRERCGPTVEAVDRLAAWGAG